MGRIRDVTLRRCGGFHTLAAAEAAELLSESDVSVDRAARLSRSSGGKELSFCCWAANETLLSASEGLTQSIGRVK